MNASIELQVISRLLTTEDENEISTLCEYDESYYSVFKDQIHYILNHRQMYGNIPDVFTFQAEFPDITLVRVSEPLSFLVRELKKNKSRIILVETFNKITELSSDDAEDAWRLDDHRFVLGAGAEPEPGDDGASARAAGTDQGAAGDQDRDPVSPRAAAGDRVAAGTRL